MSDEPAELYPRFCFDLSPTFGAWCFLKISDLEQLRALPEYAGQNFFFYKNLPIRWVRFVGLIVAVDEFATRRIYTLDDSSGAVVECVHWHDTAAVAAAAAAADADADAADATKPGAVIDVRGELCLYRSTWQLRVTALRGVRDTAAEAALWEKRRAFRDGVLRVPWVLSARQRRRAEQAAAGSKSDGGAGTGTDGEDDVDWAQAKKYLPAEYADFKAAYRLAEPEKRKDLARRIFVAVARKKTEAQRKALYGGEAVDE